ncbi:MAG: sugar transferase [Anaeromyxobacteraceae bacterium]
MAGNVSEPRSRAGRPGYRFAKRSLDVVAAVVGLLVVSPVLAVAAVAVKLSSPGPVLFRQVRVGRGGRPFRILKLRTMREAPGGPAVTAGGDARVTRAGRWLRRSKLDELPQLWNVLAGDMSLVGPRPELPRFVRRFEEAYAPILEVRPGLTDYAAIAYRDEEALLAGAQDPEAAYVEAVLPAKLALYRRYLDERSMGTDSRLLARTLGVLARPRAPRPAR